MDEKSVHSFGVRTFIDLAEEQSSECSFRDLASAMIEIEDQVAILENQGVPVDVFKQMIIDLSKFVVTYVLHRGDFSRISWPNVIQNRNLLKLLDHQVALSQPEITHDTRRGVVDLVQSVKDALRDDKSMSEAHRNYLVVLLRHTEACLDEKSIYGSFDLRAAVERLVGVLHGVVPEEKRSQGPWSKVFNKTASVFVAGMIAMAAEQTYLHINDVVSNYLNSPPPQIEAPRLVDSEPV